MGFLTAWAIVSAVNKLVKKAEASGQKPTVAEVIEILKKQFPGTNVGFAAKIVQAAFLEQKQGRNEPFVDALGMDMPEEGTTVRIRMSDGTVVLGILIRSTGDDVAVITPDEEEEVIPLADVADIEPITGGVLIGG